MADTRIRRKLMTMILATSGVVLALACAAFVGNELLTSRRNAVEQISLLGQIIAANSTGAVAFDNPGDATEVLSALKAEPQIVAACIYDPQGRIFARYPAGLPDQSLPPAAEAGGHRFSHGHLLQFTPVVQIVGSDRLGTLFLESNMAATRQRLRLYALIALIAIGVASLAAYVLSVVLQRQISRPIDALAATARAVSDRRDYSVRAEKLSTDELGLLTDAFNHMLAEIQAQNAELERRVRERTAELEAANDELEAFCFSAAHDLRTPLRAITGFSELALQHHGATLPPEVQRQLGLIHSGSEQMGCLIQDLLSFSRLGRQALAPVPLRLDAIFRSAYDELEGERRNRRVELSVTSLPAAFGDAALLRVVATNLLSNALKYTRPREVARIEIGCTEAGTAEPVIFVRDNGVGFDMRDAAKLFGVFQRLHHSHEFEGTGVGLATVRRIIERHGGRIWAQATPDGGATFSFTLPGPGAP